VGRRRSIALMVLAVLAVLAVVGAAAGCGSDGASVAASDTLGDDAITVASFDFAESRLLAELYSQALEAGGLRVVRAFDLGSRELVFPALAQGLVELVPEYAGSALQFVSLGAEVPRASAADAHGALELLLAGSQVRALDPAPAVDANAFVVSRDTARRHGLRTLSDVRRVAGELTFGGPPECGARPFCLLGLGQVYGIRFDEVLAVDVGGPLTRQALRSGHIDVGLLFSTDPELDRPDLVELVDDRRLQPAENVTPLVRVEVAERWGSALVDRLDEVSRRLTTAELRALNAAVASGEDVAATATAWLRAQGLR
jgi:osmoprotectant transport system substrate-binding protein